MFNGLCLFSFPETPDTGFRMAFLLPCYRPQGCNEGSGVPVLKSTWCWLEMGENVSTMGAEGGAGTCASQSATESCWLRQHSPCFGQVHLLSPPEVTTFPLARGRG